MDARWIRSTSERLFADRSSSIGYFTALGVTVLDAMAQSQGTWTQSQVALLDAIPGVAFRSSSDFAQTWQMSRGALSVFGCAAELFITGELSILELVDDRDLRTVTECPTRDRVVASPDGKVFRFRHRSGELRWGLMVCWATDGSGQDLVEGFVQDVTEQQRARRQAQVQASVLSALVAGGDFSSLVAEMCAEFVDSWTALTLTVTRVEQGRDPEELAVVKHQSMSGESQWNFSQSVSVAPTIDLVFVVGSTVRPTPGVRAALDQLAQLLVVAEEQHRAQRALQYAASHDWLGIANWSAAAARIGELRSCQDRPRNVVVLCLNPLRFREINQLFGYDRGSEVLVALRDRLLQHPQVSLVARMGGAELLVVAEIPGTSSGVQEFVSDVGSLIEMPLVVASQVIKLTARIGFSTRMVTARWLEAEAQDLLQEAQMACRVAEAGHVGAVAFSGDLRDRSKRQALLVRSLRAALDAERIVVEYQPQIDLRDGSVFGVEALARWPHGNHTVSPSDMIDLAERSGLISELDPQVLGTALSDMASWPGVVSVNISASQFFDPHFVPRVISMLEESKVDPRRLCIEVTESMLRDSRQATRALIEFREQGVAVAVDDFGTGFSSLSQLTQLPLDFLKIDRSFVARLGTCPEDDKVVETIISLATTIGVEVIAEGVETDFQEDKLIEMGCYLVQGWRYSKSLSMSSLGRFFSAWE